MNDQELQFFDLCSSLILMTENEKFLNETHVSLVAICTTVEGVASDSITWSVRREIDS